MQIFLKRQSDDIVALHVDDYLYGDHADSSTKRKNSKALSKLVLFKVEMPLSMVCQSKEQKNVESLVKRSDQVGAFFTRASRYPTSKA